MISLFKKVILSISIIGSALTTQAEEKKATESTVSTVLASAGVVAGGLLLADGLCYESNLLLTPETASMLGVAVAGVAGLYLLVSAKGIKAKVSSLYGSISLALSGFPLFMAMIGVGCLADNITDFSKLANAYPINFSGTIRITGVCSLAAAALIAGGYLLQPGVAQPTGNDETLAE